MVKMTEGLHLYKSFKDWEIATESMGLCGECKNGAGAGDDLSRSSCPLIKMMLQLIKEGKAKTLRIGLLKCGWWEPL
jgi:hypothetical protein